MYAAASSCLTPGDAPQGSSQAVCAVTDNSETCQLTVLKMIAAPGWIETKAHLVRCCLPVCRLVSPEWGDMITANWLPGGREGGGDLSDCVPVLIHPGAATIFNTVYLSCLSVVSDRAKFGGFCLGQALSGTSVEFSGLSRAFWDCLQLWWCHHTASRPEYWVSLYAGWIVFCRIISSCKFSAGVFYLFKDKIIVILCAACFYWGNIPSMEKLY